MCGRRNGWWLGLVSVFAVWTALIVAPDAWASEGSFVRGSDDQRTPAPENTTTDDTDVLAGPSAETADVPGSSGIFSPGMDGRTGRQGNSRLVDRWLDRILRSMGGEEADVSIRLENGQQRAIRQAMSAHEQRATAYRRLHIAELRALREQGGARRDGEQDREPTPEMNAARQRLREINQGAPTTEQVRGEVWAILNEAQRGHVNAELERLFAEREAQDADGMMGTAPADAMRAPESNDARLAALIARLEALPEAQRGRAIDRLMGVLDRYEQGAAETRRRAQAPTMDDADVRVPGEGEARQRRQRPPRGEQQD